MTQIEYYKIKPLSRMDDSQVVGQLKFAQSGNDIQDEIIKINMLKLNNEIGAPVNLIGTDTIDLNCFNRHNNDYELSGVIRRALISDRFLTTMLYCNTYNNLKSLPFAYLDVMYTYKSLLSGSLFQIVICFNIDDIVRSIPIIKNSYLHTFKRLDADATKFVGKFKQLIDYDDDDIYTKELITNNNLFTDSEKLISECKSTKQILTYIANLCKSSNCDMEKLIESGIRSKNYVRDKSIHDSGFLNFERHDASSIINITNIANDLIKNGEAIID